MEKIAILYGPSGGNTEKAARMVAEAFGPELAVLMHIRDAGEKDLAPFNKIVLGGPTVGANVWSDTAAGDWDTFLTRLYKMDLTGKTCAIFGLGDQVSYGFHFVDDIRTIYDKLVEGGARMIGKVSAEGYQFDESKALLEGSFLGLPLDEDNEPELTMPRILSWVDQLLKEFN